MTSPPDARWYPLWEAKPAAWARIFAFSYAGGSSSIYRRWQRQLPESIELHPLELPGRWGRISEPPYTRMDALIDDLVPVVRPMLGLPFALLGYSLGALVAFELARAFRREKLAAPSHLFVIARRAPHSPRLAPVLHTLAEEAFLAAVEVDFGGGLPAALLADPEARSLFAGILRSDFELLETYECRPEPPLDVPITVFHGERDPASPLRDVARWAEQTTRSFEMVSLPGAHFLSEAEGGRVLAQMMSAMDALE